MCQWFSVDLSLGRFGLTFVVDVLVQANKNQDQPQSLALSDLWCFGAAQLPDYLNRTYNILEPHENHQYSIVLEHFQMSESCRNIIWLSQSPPSYI